MALVYVVVINWNGKEHLAECFSSLLRTTYGRARFLLVDNGSRDGSAEFVAERFGADARLEILELEENRGWSGGNNAGMAYALERGADYILLLNNDTVTDAEAIGRLVEQAERDPSIGALAPKVLLYDHPDLLNSIGLDASIIGAAWDRGLGRLDAPKWDEVREVIGVCGAAFWLRAETLRITGPFSEDFEIYLDDLDLCLRIWNAGHRIETCPAAVVRHKFSATMREGPLARRKYYLNTRNRLRVIERNFPLLLLPSVAPRFVLGECKAVGRALLDGDWGRAAAHGGSWLSGVAYVPIALRARMAQRGTRHAANPFWRLLRRDVLFFPGTELPERGWYSEREVAGARVRPMSRRATFEHAGGRLRLVAANPHPRCGPARVDVRVDGACILEMETERRAEYEIEPSAGTLEFVAKQIFDADVTGELIDIGGWIGISPAP